MDFRILGPLEVRQDGHPLPCRGTKQRLLLAVLLLRANEVVSSDLLIEALWGEKPPPTAPKALQMHVSQLRRLLDPGRAAGSPDATLRTRPPGYELRVAGGQLDLHRFEHAVDEARAASEHGHLDEAAELLENGLALWRGPPLADLCFEEVLQPDIARLEELHLAAIEDRIDAELALGHHLALIGELERLAAQHPLRERIRGQLMLAFYRSGRQAEALEVYRDTRRLLVEELGLEPTRELKTLEERILGQDPALDPPARDPPGTAASAGIVGRERELAELLPIADAALAGRGAVVLIGGEPGIGKSRLAEALARHAADRDAQVAVGRCWEAGGAPPLWPWVQALQALRDADRDELAGLLGERPGMGASEAGARFRMFAAVADFLRYEAATAPVALFLDDLHAADPASLLLLRFVAAQLADAPVVVVGCYRDTEVGAELAETLAELAREPSFRRLSLGGLDAAATSRLLATTMGAAPAPELAARVHAETHGNPLFAGEIGRLLSAEANADPAVEHLPIPEGVRDVIRRRLQRQSAPCRELLVMASVLGREFDLATVAAVGRLDDEALLAAIEQATAARLISEVPGTSERLRFAHILVRDALYEDLPAPRRLRLHRQVGDALEEVHALNLDPRTAELAFHFVAAGSLATEKAIDYSERAGDLAAAQYGYEQAARHYQVALDLLERHSAPDVERTCALLLALGNVLSRAGSSGDAKDVFRRAATIADEHGWHDQLVRAALGYGGRFAWPRASTDHAYVPLLERALEVVETSDPLARARLLARLAAAIRDEPRRERRAAIAEEALAIARRSGDPVTLAYALEGYGVATEELDPGPEVLATADELVTLGQQLGDKERVFTGHDFRLNALWKLADRAGVEVEIEAETLLADELGQPAQQWHTASSRTALALMEGRFDDAERLIAHARPIGERAEGWNARVSERLQLFVLRRAQGRLAEFEDVMRRSVHEYPTLLRFRCALAHLCAELDNASAARAALDELHMYDIAHEHHDAEWLVTVCLLPDVYRSLGDRDAAAKLYRVLLPRERLYAQAPIEATFGSVARALGVLATTLGHFDDAERHFRVALETERRMRARPWLAHAQHDMAAMLLTRGERADERAAHALLTEAIATYRELGMGTWAVRASALRRSRATARA
jgi:DNA-binding SARP family transcriptional activator